MLGTVRGRLSGDPGFRQHCCVLADLFHEVKEVAVSIRSVGRPSLLLLIDVLDRRVDALDRRLAKVEKGGLGNGPFLEIKKSDAESPYAMPKAKDGHLPVPATTGPFRDHADR
jgi:hypothetical protein